MTMCTKQGFNGDRIYSGLNEEINGRISFSKLTLDQDAKYKLLLKQVGRT
jgi:hypothetical protein